MPFLNCKFHLFILKTYHYFTTNANLLPIAGLLFYFGQKQKEALDKLRAQCNYASNVQGSALHNLEFLKFINENKKRPKKKASSGAKG